MQQKRAEEFFLIGCKDKNAAFNTMEKNARDIHTAVKCMKNLLEGIITKLDK